LRGCGQGNVTRQNVLFESFYSLIGRDHLRHEVTAEPVE
jgi:hypothetical protein